MGKLSKSVMCQWKMFIFENISRSIDFFRSFIGMKWVEVSTSKPRHLNWG